MRRTPTSFAHYVYHCSRRAAAVIGLAALSTSLPIGLFSAPVGHASLGTCGSDPVVILSNGVIVDLYTTIYTADADVQQVLYSLQAPTGTTAISVIRTSGLIGPKEVVMVYDDNAPDTYSTTTVVTTRLTGIPVTARTSAVPLVGLPATASTAGYAQQTLRVSVTV